MGLFSSGFNLPPGCGTLPGEEDGPCAVCNGNIDGNGENFGDCVCVECPVCGDVGNPSCYYLAPGYCGQRKEPKQLAQFAYFNVLWMEESRLESERESLFFKQELEEIY